MAQVSEYPYKYQHNQESSRMTPLSRQSSPLNADLRLCVVRTSSNYPGIGLHLSRTEKNSGIVITTVEQGSPAAACGIMVGDRIIEINNTYVESMPFMKILQVLQAQLKNPQVEFLVTSSQTSIGPGVDKSHARRMETPISMTGDNKQSRDSDAMTIASLVSKSTGEPWNSVIEDVNKNYGHLNPRPLTDDSKVSSAQDLDREFRETLSTMRKQIQNDIFRNDPELSKLMTDSKSRNYRSHPVVMERLGHEAEWGISIVPDTEVGHIVSSVAPGSAAERANIRRGHVIIQMGDDVVLHLPHKKLISKFQNIPRNRVFLSVAPKDVIMRCAVEHIPILTQYDMTKIQSMRPDRSGSIPINDGSRHRPMEGYRQQSPSMIRSQQPLQEEYRPPAESFHSPSSQQLRDQFRPPSVQQPRDSFNAPSVQQPRDSFNPPPMQQSRDSFNPPPMQQPRDSFNPPLQQKFDPPANVGVTSQYNPRYDQYSQAFPGGGNAEMDTLAKSVPVQPPEADILPAPMDMISPPGTTNVPSDFKQTNQPSSYGGSTEVRLPGAMVESARIQPTATYDQIPSPLPPQQEPKPAVPLGFPIDRSDHQASKREQPGLPSHSASEKPPTTYQQVQGTEAGTGQSAVADHGVRTVVIPKKKSSPVGFQLKSLDPDGGGSLIHAFGDIMKGYIADQVGIREGDRLIRLDGVPVDGMSHLQVLEMLKRDVPQLTVEVCEDELVKNALRSSRVPTILEPSVPTVKAPVPSPPLDKDMLALTLNVDKSNPSIGLRLTKDMIIQSVEQGGVAQNAGVKPGDIIQSINGKQVNRSEYQATFNALKDSIASGRVDLVVKRPSHGKGTEEPQISSDEAAVQLRASGQVKPTSNIPEPSKPVEPKYDQHPPAYTERAPSTNVPSSSAVGDTGIQSGGQATSQYEPLSGLTRKCVLTNLTKNSPIGVSLKDNRENPAEITKVAQDSPASRAGLQVHDFVLQINGENVEHAKFSDIKSKITSSLPTGKLELIVIKDEEYEKYKGD